MRTAVSVAVEEWGGQVVSSSVGCARNSITAVASWRVEE
jgi:hypothetical protein